MSRKQRIYREELEKLIQTSEQGKILREGLSTVIIGRPNVGKSSLLNSLVQENKAIVTDIPGTTRDIIEEYVNVRGVPLRLVDTAGIQGNRRYRRKNRSRTLARSIEESRFNFISAQFS